MRRTVDYDFSDTKAGVVVKNLPTELTQKGIEHLFGRIGKVKRVHFKKLSPGKQQQFLNALIIYENADDVQSAVRFFNGFKIGYDGPELRVSVALTAEEKQMIKRNRALEQKLSDDIQRSPGFSESRFLEMPKLGNSNLSMSNLDDSRNQDGDAGIKSPRSMYVVNFDGTTDIIVEKDVPSSLTVIAIQLDLLRYCRKCGKECSYMCCELAKYCSLVCQKADWENHVNECSLKKVGK